MTPCSFSLLLLGLAWFLAQGCDEGTPGHGPALAQHWSPVFRPGFAKGQLADLRLAVP